jgi:hypothetical protein
VKLIACLSWFDEDPGQLAELVITMARAEVDHIVAVDGAYALFPQAKGGSPSEQAAAVLYAARGAGIGVTIHVPPHPWVGNECEKRSFLFAAAHLAAEAGKDWLWVLDADEVIESADGLRAALEATDRDVAEVLLTDDGSAVAMRMLFRALEGGIRVVGTHSTYLDALGRQLWAPAGDVVAAEQLFDVRVRHRPSARSVLREAAQERYCQLRDEVGAEDPVVFAS